MTTEMLIIAIVRLAGALPVLRWPLAGALIAMAVDQSDLFMMNLLDLGGVNDYQTFDKYLDQAYLLTFLIVALRWQDTARTVAVVLYFHRLIGFVAFEASGEREVLLFFPNFFEYWFVLMAALKHLGRDPFVEGTGSWSVRGSEDKALAGGGGGMVRVAAVQEGAIPRQRPLAPSTFAGIVGVLVAVKLFQEYALHYGRWLDGFTAVEAVEAIWRFLTPPY